MIGYVGTGSSFFGGIKYCLEDKKELSEEKKKQLSQQDNLQHKERSEVLAYNQCGGNLKELTQQFKEVAQLSKRVEKPVFHFSLRLAPGDSCTKNELIEMGEACAKQFGVDKNQYLIALHKDTREQHIHIIANRVGYDGKVASDSNSYRKMAQLCRSLEKQFHLKEVLSPRAFLSKEERAIPRHDLRKEKLHNDIREIVKQATGYRDFESKMKSLGYDVIKGRGIAFMDEKKVKTKGSEVGFSLAKIEKALSLQSELALKKAEQKIHDIAGRQEKEKQVALTPGQQIIQHAKERQPKEHAPLEKRIHFLEKAISELLKYTPTYDHLPFELTQEGYEHRKRKEKYQSPSR